MEIVFKKGNTKNTITCRRDDGSATWTEGDAFMIRHDLTHLVVERTLGMRQGFYGLLKSGLDITDFERKQKITPRTIPREAIKAEMLVNLLLVEQHDQQRVDDFNKTFHEAIGDGGESFDEKTIVSMREGLAGVLREWDNLPPGQTLKFEWQH